MDFGYFNDKNKEYVIKRPNTPLPWINYLGCEDFFGIISNTGGGYSFYRDARYRRLTRYRYNNVPFDVGGRYIYLRNNNNEEFWSPNWQPTRDVKLENYSCRHGLGYTIIQSTYENITATISCFVPLDDTLEIWKLDLTNIGNQSLDLSIYSCVEFCLWDALDDATNFQRNFNIGEVEIEVESSIIYHKTEYRERRNHFAYFACSEKLKGFDTQRGAFFGDYGSWEKPEVVETGKSKNSIAHGWAPIGSHHVNVVLEPQKTKTIVFLLGYHENPQNQKFDPPNSTILNKKFVKPIISKYLNINNVNKGFTKLKDRWKSYLDILQVNTPNEHVNRMVNIWNPYQCMVTFNLSRSASFFESGISRGIGFRDSNQDILGFTHMVPQRAKERILDLAATQLLDGGAYHQYQPLTKRGNDEIGDNFNDDPLWLVLSVAQYLKETNDWSILDEEVVYENKAGTEESLLSHLERSLNYTLEHLGPHGLALIGRADWNDCLNLNCYSENPDESFQTTTNRKGNIAESVFISSMFVLAANEFIDILEYVNKPEKAIYYQNQATRMKEAIKEYGWDGNWFLRAYDSKSRKIGSKHCKEGKIYIESQGFSIMAGLGLENGWAEQALDSVRTHLATEHGIVLLDPPYSRYRPRLGEISSYPEGYKENGSVFCHTNPWIMIAEAMLGNADRAFDYYLRICPSARENISEIHKCEPYVYAQTIAGKEAPTFGEAKNSWLTGTAAWNFVAITQWILGIRPTFKGLKIDPKIPKDWSGFTATRVFRGVIYNINVERKGPGQSVVIFVDNNKIDGNIIFSRKLDSKKIAVKVHIH